jgi:methionyl-tRNA formyltransferase
MLNIIYAGTPEFAVPALQSLLQSDHRVVAVYTQPDRPSGRGRKLHVGPVKACAQAHDIPVYQPDNFKSQSDIDAIKALNADLIVVAAYGLILPQAVLDAANIGCINIHASLLPRWRGASPIQQVILAGDQQSGITLMKMEKGLDTGAIIASRSVDIDSRWSATELHDVLAPLGAELLIENLDHIENRLNQALPQDESLVSYAPLIRKAQAEINWNKPALKLMQEIRAFNSWPVSYTTIDGELLRIWCAQPQQQYTPGAPGTVVAHDVSGVYVSCSDAVVQITELQYAGRRRCSARDALNARDLTGVRFGGG